MDLSTQVADRANHCCELCGQPPPLSACAVEPFNVASLENHIAICADCQQQIDGADNVLNSHHWRCLNDSMWSTTGAVQVMAWRILRRLSSETWAQHLLDMMYMEPELQKWAMAGDESGQEPTLDSNGVALQAGDNVVIIKDLVVKGAGFTAKRGTPVRGIGLTDNPAHVEGRVNGQRIVLKAEYLKRS